MPLYMHETRLSKSHSNQLLHYYFHSEGWKGLPITIVRELNMTFSRVSASQAEPRAHPCESSARARAQDARIVVKKAPDNNAITIYRRSASSLDLLCVSISPRCARKTNCYLSIENGTSACNYTHAQTRL